MSTKATVRTSPTITEQTSASHYDTFFAQWSPSLMCVVDVNPLVPMMVPAYYQESKKAVEAFRQIERARTLSTRCAGLNDPAAEEMQRISVESCIALISSLLTSPMPIPVASSGSECGATLFFNGAGLYGDLEIKGRIVEYYLKSTTEAGTQEIFDSETIDDGFIPPKLLGHLFSAYSR
jgi:hypothetical protein